jgi:uncharacterized protein YdhG (YjbR/CyaY superfamily)
MQNRAITPKNIDEYIAGFPAEVQAMLEQLRATIKRVAPQAEETISYQMPTFKIQGNLVHFAAYQHHIGFYPAPSGISAFLNELKQYKNAKGSVQFPVDRPLPLDLIARIVEFRAKENLQKAARKVKKK